MLRFFAIKNELSKFKHDVRDFLTDYMEAVSEPNPFERLNFDYKNEKLIFEKTFNIFAVTLGEKSFGFPNKNRDSITKGFSTLHFEALTVGIQKNLLLINLDSDDKISDFTSLLSELKLDSDFIKLTFEGGKNSPGLLKARVKFVEDYIEKSFQAI